MELAAITSRGQMSLPNYPKATIIAGKGDRIAFMQKDGGFFVVNADCLLLDRQKVAEQSKKTLRNCQKGFEGFAEEHGLKDLDDVVALVKEVRKENYASIN